MAHLNRSIRLSTKHHLWYPSPSRSVLLSFSLAMPAANAHPCKYAMTKIGNSCIRIHSKEGRKKQYVHGYWNEASNVQTDDAGERTALGTSSLKLKAIVFFPSLFSFPFSKSSFSFWFGNSTAASTRYYGCKDFHFWGNSVVAVDRNTSAGGRSNWSLGQCCQPHNARGIVYKWQQR